MPNFAKLIIAFFTPLVFSTSISVARADSDNPADEKSKPLVALIFDQTCKVWCKQVRPVMKELKDEYGNKVTFVELDATESIAAETKKRAKELGNWIFTKGTRLTSRLQQV